ncbi:MAG: hypothetical protein IPK64_05955 [bacterium]|nr:hypothetical protein [bacterium]
MDSRQFCSVCKQWLDMEVVQTADGDDDGVIWFRCPQCEGFLPKLSSAVAGPAAVPDRTDPESNVDDEAKADAGPASVAGDARRGQASVRLPVANENHGDDHDDDDVDDDNDETGGGLVLGGLVFGDRIQIEEADEPADLDHDAESAGGAPSAAVGTGASAEPVLEYAAQLAAADPVTAVPYRPWDTYEVGQCVLHLAWNDCGIVVAKEALPGGRRIIKCWFQGAGVVRLIENTPR